MRDLVKFLVVGIMMFIAPFAMAEQYKVLVLPDNVATENETIDSYIYNATAEFFAAEVINLLNQTDYITAPTISEERALLKDNPSHMLSAKNLTNKFKTSYNIDYVQLKKVANKSQAKYVLLLTSTIDAENYILRRTVWDFMNVPGASVIDPAYKINTYAALVDLQKNSVLWSNTFYKTISTVENRIITRGPSPQTEQLQKIRDYSRMICPEIAQNVQKNILPKDIYSKESQQIYYDMGNFDNVFTKKYRRWYKEGSKDFEATRQRTADTIDTTKVKLDEQKTKAQAKIKQYKEKRAEKIQEKQLRVKAEPVSLSKPGENEPTNIKPELKPSIKINNIHNVNFKRQTLEDESLFLPINIKRTRTNNLYGDFDNSRPALRDYN